MDILMQVGLRMKEIRQTRGLTQAALAEACGLSRGYVCEIEAGRRNISTATLGRILAALEVSPREFFALDAFADDQPGAESL